MKIHTLWAAIFALSIALTVALPLSDDAGAPSHTPVLQNVGKVAPKVFIITHFPPEEAIWHEGSHATNTLGEFSRLISVPGLSPRSGKVSCLRDGSLCIIQTGMAETNAAASILALTMSPLFALQKTYFLISGIGGVNPKAGTLGDVAFAKYAVQVALQYEVDARDLSSEDNMTTGYVPFGSTKPGQYPQEIYGTEVFEVNAVLRDIAADLARKPNLADSDVAKAYRQLYVEGNGQAFANAAKKPAVKKCDVATSDVWYSGSLLSQTFDDTMKLLTNGSAQYCMTAQEDTATLSSLLRAATFNAVDLSRVIIMRAASNFDRQYPNSTAINNLLHSNSGGFPISIENLFRAGVEVVKGILSQWDDKFAKGIPAQNYVGDILNTLGGKPDFGLPSAQFGVEGFKGEHLMGDEGVTKRKEALIGELDGLTGSCLLFEELSWRFLATIPSS